MQTSTLGARPAGRRSICRPEPCEATGAATAAITWVLSRDAFYQFLERLMDAGLGKRLMYGSDQMRWPEKIEAAIQTIREAPFPSADERRDIFYNKAARFLRMPAGRRPDRGDV